MTIEAARDLFHAVGTGESRRIDWAIWHSAEPGSRVVIATLSYVIAVSAVTWDPQTPAVALATPVVAAFLAIFTALDLRKVRRVTWLCLALQLAVLVIIYVTTPTP